MAQFTTDFLLDYRGIRADLTVTFPRLMEYLQEASLRHTQSTKYPMKWYEENGRGFLLVHWQVEVSNYPSYGDTIEIATWPLYFKGVLAEREFEMRNGSGEVMARANSKWVFTDIVRHRPVRPPADMGPSYGEVGDYRLPKDYDLPEWDGFEKINEAQISVTRREADSNKHVNNIRYLEWSMDYIPDEIYDSLCVTHMKTAYKKECAIGLCVTVETWAGASGREFMTLIRDPIDRETVYTQVYTQWG